jgi:hypothetical protein|nr:NADH dehydrogenase ubiquinone Fe-S protein 4 [Sphingopyxis sp. FD7]
MARPPEAVARTIGPIPDDVRAIVEPVPWLASSGSGRRFRDRWRVRFAPRWAPSIDPLTGWTGGGDPLATVELHFASRRSAEAYCRRAGIPFKSRGAPPSLPRAAKLPPDDAMPLCCWPTGPHPRCCGRYPVALRFAARKDDDAPRAA